MLFPQLKSLKNMAVTLTQTLKVKDQVVFFALSQILGIAPMAA
jgi:hypothetical protein